MSKTSTGWGSLPAELKVEIFSFVDAATAWEIMRTKGGNNRDLVDSARRRFYGNLSINTVEAIEKLGKKTSMPESFALTRTLKLSRYLTCLYDRKIERVLTAMPNLNTISVRLSGTWLWHDDPLEIYKHPISHLYTMVEGKIIDDPGEFRNSLCRESATWMINPMNLSSRNEHLTEPKYVINNTGQTKNLALILGSPYGHMEELLYRGFYEDEAEMESPLPTIMDIAKYAARIVTEVSADSTDLYIPGVLVFSDIDGHNLNRARMNHHFIDPTATDEYQATVFSLDTIMRECIHSSHPDFQGVVNLRSAPEFFEVFTPEMLSLTEKEWKTMRSHASNSDTPAIYNAHVNGNWTVVSKGFPNYSAERRPFLEEQLEAFLSEQQTWPLPPQ